MWLTRAGPYHNPQETYSYNALPLCAPLTPLEPQHRFAGLSEVFEGTEWVNSDLVVRFGVDRKRTPYCSVTLEDDSAAFLDYAIANHYVYQMVIDDLPVWGMVGEMVTGEEALRHLQQVGESIEEERALLGTSEHVESVTPEQALSLADRAYMFTHKRLSIGYAGRRIVEVNLTNDEPQHVEAGKSFDLSYSVKWVPSQRQFESRFARFMESSFFEHKVHWVALLNSFLTVIVVVALVALVLGRTVHTQLRAILSDQAAESVAGTDADAEAGVPSDAAVSLSAGDSAAWKLLHGEVFRLPPHAELLAALLGTGVQLLLMGIVVVGVAALRALFADKGYTASAVLGAYAVTSFVAGYVSGSWFRAQARGPKGRWQFVMFLTASLLPATAVALLGPLNLIAWRASTINTISFANVLTLLALWVVLSLPLCVLGTLAGRRSITAQQDREAPRVNPMMRPIRPTVAFYAHPLSLTFLAGLAPFACVFIEAYFVLSSFWGYKVYFVYGFLLLVLVMLAVVTACTSLVATYVALSAEDYRWPWLAFSSGASVSVYLFLYSVYYLVAKTQMHGMVQIAFFFAYSSLICVAVAIGCGAVGFFAASAFVRVIYADIKAA